MARSIRRSAGRPCAVARDLLDSVERARQLERAAVSGVMDALSNQLAGRFVRAQTAAQEALDHLKQLPDYDLPRHGQLTALAHLLVAESAHALQNRDTRDHHQRLAIAPGLVRQGNETREGALLRAARWAVEDRDPAAAAAWLAELPQGAARRIVALRLRLRVARMQRDASAALEMARVLAKHRAYSSEAAPSVLRGLVLDTFKGARDVPQLQQIWRHLDPAEQAMPELAVAAAERMHALAASSGQDDSAARDEAARLARDVVLSVWPGYAALDAHWRVRLVKVLAHRMDVTDTGWLARISAFTSASIAAMSSAVSAVGCEKSNRRRSAATSEPFCVTCAPSRLRSAAWARWVAEWLARIASRRATSMSSRTTSPTLTVPARTVPLWA